MLKSPWLAALFSLFLNLVWMRLNNLLATKNIVSSSTSRKPIHIGTGSLFVVSWLLFPDNPGSRYLAALIPFLIVLQLALVGFGVLKDNSSVKAMARTGSKQELLRGPFFYGLVFVIITIFFWKSPQGIISLMILCGGDGLADMIGSRVKSPVIPWTKSKTLAGSMAMFFGGTLFSLLLLALFIWAGIIDQNFATLILPVLGISAVATLVETITPSDFDNLSVPAVALILSLIFI